MVKRAHMSILALGMLILFLFFRICFWAEPWNFELGVLQYTGQRILDGVMPYRDMITHYPPIVPLIYSLMHALGLENMLTLLGLLGHSILCYGVFHITFRLYKNPAAAFISLLLQCVMPMTYIWSSFLQTDIVMMCFCIWGYFFWMRETKLSACIAALLMVSALFSKPLVVPLVVTLFILRNPLRSLPQRIFVTTTGAICVTGVLILQTLSNGTFLQEMNGLFCASPLSLAQFQDKFDALLRYEVFPLLLGLCGTTAMTIKQKKHQFPVFLMAGMATSFMAILRGPTGINDLIVAEPFLAIAGGILIVYLLEFVKTQMEFLQPAITRAFTYLMTGACTCFLLVLVVLKPLACFQRIIYGEEELLSVGYMRLRHPESISDLYEAIESYRTKDNLILADAQLAIRSGSKLPEDTAWAYAYVLRYRRGEEKAVKAIRHICDLIKEGRIDIIPLEYPFRSFIYSEILDVQKVVNENYDCVNLGESMKVALPRRSQSRVIIDVE